jgi:hypothetical protein
MRAPATQTLTHLRIETRMKEFSRFIGSCFIIGILALGCDSVVDTPGGTNVPHAMEPGRSAASSHGTTIVVNDDNLGVDWMFVAESGGGTGEFVDGPASPPIGTGSAQISISASGDGFALIGSILQGTRLADVEELEYGTYRSVSANAAWAVALQFNMNYDPATNPTNVWQGRLVFEPYYSATVQTGAWQTWDPLSQRGWWATGAPGNGVCLQDAPCTWAEVLAAFPDAAVRDDDGPVVFKAGSNWGEFTGNVDGLTITIDGETTTYDFEPKVEPVDPTSIQDCQQGGWEAFGFRNQGQCIRFVNTGEDTR